MPSPSSERWIWVPIEAVLANHDRYLADYGGLEGVRDIGALEGALGRPQNLAVYENSDVSTLAAMYAVGIARAHAFSDANKRTAWGTAAVFLWLNGYDLRVPAREAVATIKAAATGELSLADMAHWLRERIERR